jgi:myo-inositol-1(or 4)-monophosphatase
MLFRLALTSPTVDNSPMSTTTRADDLLRIRHVLESVANMIQGINRHEVSVSYSPNGDPVTALDRAINQLLHETLPQTGEAWLSEESRDDLSRLQSSRVWVVDPIDGTREYIEGLPMWCVSVGLVEDHQAVAGGILNPSTGELFLGSIETGLEVLGPVRAKSAIENGTAPLMLVSRREHGQGKWSHFESSELRISPIGSIAYRLAQVASGYAEATCTFDPRSEWDVAAGVALVHATGGRVQTFDGTPIRFNQRVPNVQSFFAFGKDCPDSIPKKCGVAMNPEGNQQRS